MWRPAARRSSLAVAITAIVLVTGSSGSARPAATAACPASPVHYERALTPPAATLPWVVAEPQATRLVGRLFYYSGTWGRNHVRTFRIYTGGRSPDDRMNMKILWTAPAPLDERVLTVRATRTDGGRFVRRLAVGPSILDVPTPGCWRLSLSLGRVATRLTVLAIRGR